MILNVALALHALWVVFAFVALMGWRRLREIGGMADVPIAKLRPGMDACVQGRTAFHGAARTSPLGAAPAVWFDWLVQRDSDPLKDFPMRGGEPLALASGSSTEPFALIDDGGNRLLVWPARAELLEPREDKWDGEYPAAIDGTLRDRLVRGVDLAAPLTDPGALHFTERWLPSGAPCFVVGRVEAPGPEHGLDVRGLIREGGARDFLISTGVPVDALAAQRRQMTYAAIGAAVAFALAVVLTIYALGASGA